MQPKLILKYNNGFAWYSNKNIHLKGYAFYGDSFLTGQDMVNFINKRLINNEKLFECLKSLNGVFSLVLLNEDSVYIYSDKTRFFPLFYSLKGGTFTVSDDPKEIISGDSEINTLAAEEFRRTGYVTGSDTLFQDIKQIQGGELLQFKNEKITSEILFSFKVKDENIQHYQNPISEMQHYLDNAFHRLTVSLTGKTPIIPLSGGFDSRLIATKIKESGFSNAICFTYGRPGKEAEISREVARRLGFKWYFINYEEILANRVIIQEDDFKDYYPYASRGTSMFYLQEYPATEFLKKKGLIPENSVFIPGHSGDLLGGSQFIKVFQPDLKAKDVAKQILATKYFLFPTNKKLKRIFYQKICSSLGETKNYNGYSLFEDYDIKEKIAKFIFNSSQVFTFFGYEVRFPFWDEELVEFFRTCSPEYRIGKKLYDQCLIENYFAKFNTNFNSELQPRLLDLKIQALKDLIKPLLPSGIKKGIIRKNDMHCYHEMATPMLRELSLKQQSILPYNNNNSILINWYLDKITLKSKS